MLRRVYLRWAERRGAKTNILDDPDGNEAGIDAASCTVTGPAPWGYLRSEAGVHRLVRRRPFSADRTRQTAFATVENTPDISDDIDITTMRERQIVRT